MPSAYHLVQTDRNPEPTMTRWTLWTTSPHFGDLRDCVGHYVNHGHALSALRGFRRRAWAAGSEINYTIRKDC